MPVKPMPKISESVKYINIESGMIIVDLYALIPTSSKQTQPSPEEFVKQLDDYLTDNYDRCFHYSIYNKLVKAIQSIYDTLKYISSFDEVNVEYKNPHPELVSVTIHELILTIQTIDCR